MKIDTISRLFGGYQSAVQTPKPQTESEKAKQEDDAAKVSVSAVEESDSARAEKIQQLKAKNEAGTLRYDSEKIAVALVRDLGI